MKTYYVKSTGEIIGPNDGVPNGQKNRQRKQFGNLFTSKKKAQRAAKLIKLVLRFVR